MRNRTLLWAVGGLVVGILLGAAAPIVRAQSDSCAGGGPWDVKTGRSAEGHNWYAVKFNRCTGEAWVLGAEGGVGDDKWLALPLEKPSAK